MRQLPEQNSEEIANLSTMDTKQRKRKSKFLSLVLRHQPEQIGIQLDPAGWVDVDELLEALSSNRRGMSLEQLQAVVQQNDKQRFSFSADGKRIRASQGHSVEVDLGYESVPPPEFLLHGTPEQFLPAIRESGLKRMQRHHVHLHEDTQVATAVGQRRGKSVILKIRASEMHLAGHLFYVTPNSVWLVDQVPPEYIEFP